MDVLNSNFLLSKSFIFGILDGVLIFCKMYAPLSISYIIMKKTEKVLWMTCKSRSRVLVHLTLLLPLNIERGYKFESYLQVFSADDWYLPIRSFLTVKILTIAGLALGTRIKVILDISDVACFYTSFKSRLAIHFYEIRSMSQCIHKSWAEYQYISEKIFQKSVPWSCPHKMPSSALLILGQFLGI